MKLYHVSKTPNLKELKPKVSTHDKPYVYATSNLNFALLFGSNCSFGDFDGMYGINEETNIPYFYEAYKGAFKRRFNKQKCYIYEVDSSTFKEGKTSFSGEVVSEVPVKVLSCTKIDDLYSYLIDLAIESKIDIYEYEDTEKYREIVDKHIMDRLIRFKVLDNKMSPVYLFCKMKFPNAIEKLKKGSNITR